MKKNKLHDHYYRIGGRDISTLTVAGNRANVTVTDPTNEKKKTTYLLDSVYVGLLKYAWECGQKNKPLW